MWQDWVITAVQFVFCVNLVPMVLAGSGRWTPLETSLSTAVGMYVIAGVTVTLGLVFAMITSVIIGTLWAVLAFQRIQAR